MARTGPRSRPVGASFLVTRWPRPAWYGLPIVAGWLVTVACANPLGFHVAWTGESAVLIVDALLSAPPPDRRRLGVAVVAWTASLFALARLLDRPDLGVLAVVGDGKAVAILAVLAMLAGALIRTRWLLALLAGVWFGSVAASFWWLIAVHGRASFLAAWRTLLPDKIVPALLGSGTYKLFQLADAFWLATAFATVIVAAAIGGGFVGRTVRKESVHASRFHVRDLWVMVPVALIACVFGYYGITLAVNGIPAVWEEPSCDSFISICTPSDTPIWLIPVSFLALVVAALGHLGSRLVHRLRARSSREEQDHSPADGGTHPPPSTP